MTVKQVTIAVLLALTACSPKSAADQRADTIEHQADTQARLIKQRADDEAARLLNSSAALANQATQIGGFTGDRLQEQSDSLRRQAAIVKKQGRAQADAVDKQGDAQAEAIRSQ